MNDPEVTEMLQRKQLLYEKLLSFSQQQAALSFVEKPAEYQELMELKTLCFEEITKNEIILKQALRDDGSGTAQLLYDANRTALFDTVKKIQRLDETSKSAVKQEQIAVKKRIATIQTGKKGTAGYNANQKVNTAGAYTDKRR